MKVKPYEPVDAPVVVIELDEDEVKMLKSMIYHINWSTNGPISRFASSLYDNLENQVDGTAGSLNCVNGDA